MMTETNLSNVPDAFEVLIAEIESELDFVSRLGARSFEQHDYDKAQQALKHSADVAKLLQQVRDLSDQWDRIGGFELPVENETPDSERHEPAAVHRPQVIREHSRSQRGARTPESAFFRPILQVLVQMGGRGPMAKVIHQVEQIMKPLLSDVDFEPLSRSGGEIRWRNSLRWARNKMVREGLLRDDSPRGIWEVTDKGREFLGASE